MSNEVNVTKLPILGKTIKNITVIKDSRILFTCEDGTGYEMTHDQDCCEDVSIEQIDGDTKDLIGSPLVMAESSTKDNPDPEDSCGQWTFYKFATAKSFVTIRWYGISNGWYSVDVDFREIDIDLNSN